MRGKILKGQRVTLRPMKLEHAPLFRAWMNDKEAVKYLRRQTAPSLEAEKKWVRNSYKDKGEIFWTIYNEENMLIGNTSIRLKPNHKKANFGIFIGEKIQWGKGYAGECLELLKKYVFDKLEYNRFDLTVNANNKRAIRAYKKSGFVKEGTLRQDEWNIVTKQFEDIMYMSILNREYLR